MNADGSNQTQLTEGAQIDNFRASTPSWSPDGTKIVFTCFRYTDSQQVCEVDTRDGSQRALTHSTDSSVSYDPSFSPDGTKIVFVNDGRIYVMNAEDGSGQTQLTNIPFKDSRPNWGAAQPHLKQLSKITPVS